MNEALAQAQNTAELETIDPLRFPVLAVPTKKSAQQIPAKADNAIHGILSIAHDIVATVVSSQDGSQFERLLPSFANLVLAYSTVIRQTVTPDVMRQVVWESLMDEEGEFREQGQAMFGDELKERAIFTVWTLRKIGDLIDKFAALPLNPTHKKVDVEFCRNFAVHAIRARFALECLRFAAHRKSALSPELIDSVVDGMRSAVDSYAWAKEGYNLRLKAKEPELAFEIPWEEEDEELLRESMEDLRTQDPPLESGRRDLG